jgi:hypothetical protein
VPLAFNAAFAFLAARFDYPDILRRPTDEVLERYREGRTALVLVWWAFALTAVLFAPTGGPARPRGSDADGTLLDVGVTVGVLAAVVQFLGLIRQPFLVPYLARAVAEPTQAPRDARPQTSSSSPSTAISAWRSGSISAMRWPALGACSPG